MVSDLSISPSQAHYVLSKLLDNRTITRRDVASCLSMMQKEINELEHRLGELRALSDGDAPEGPKRRRARTATRKRASKKKGAKKKARKAGITPQQLASRKLQGVYMSLLRRIPKSKRAQYQRLAKEKDRQSAVDAMKAVLGL